jgi:hypothetical protein
MSSPVVPINNTTLTQNDSPPDDRLKRIVDALAEYHKELLIKYSHFTQSPQELIAIQTLLREKAKIIRNYLLYNKLPDNVDPQLKECLDNLKSANTPWNPEVSILTNYWCDLMFIKHPFTMSDKHIKNLLRNSTSVLEDDRSSPENPYA